MSHTAKRASRYIIAIVIIFSLNFIIPRAMPGDPLTNLLGEDVILTDSTVAELRSEMGLDRSWSQQYLDYWWGILHLDLGYSFHLHSPVSEIIFSRMKWTLLLALPSLILGGGAGHNSRSARRLEEREQRPEDADGPFPVDLLHSALLSLLAGPLSALLQACSLSSEGILSTGSATDIAHHLFLPILVMTLFSLSRNYMIMRGSVLQEKSSLYAAYARAKGLYDDEILFRHVFKNALLPIITLLAMDFGFILSGALFIEIVFSMNGMGNLIYDALLSRDYPVLQGSFLVITIMVVSANLLADLLYSRLDPRVRWQ